MDTNLNGCGNNVFVQNNFQNIPVQNVVVEHIEHKKVFRIAAWISYLVGFFYLKHVLVATLNEGFINHTKYSEFWGYLVFGILFVIGTEVFSHFVGLDYKTLKETKKSVVEPIVFIACIVLQSVGLFVWGFHEDWEFYQFMIWHFMIVYYVMARTGCLAAGRSGILFLLDCFQATVTTPCMNAFFRTYTILRKGCMFERKSVKDKAVKAAKKSISSKTIVTVLVSVCIAFFVCGYAALELAGSSSTFNNLGSAIFGGIDNFFEAIFNFFDEIIYKFEENLGIFICSIPVSCWLFALVGGCLRKKKPFCTERDFDNFTKEFHVLPSYSAYIVIGSVCVLYAVFCGTAVYDFIFRKGLFAGTAHEASVRSVESFWNLIRVVMMNFAIVAASCVFSVRALWDEKKTRILGTLLIAFALIFAVLAAWNLGVVYIAAFGITPRRILSSLVIFNVIAWCILMLIRFYKKIPAAQIGIILGAISFSVVVCFNF